MISPVRAGFDPPPSASTRATVLLRGEWRLWPAFWVGLQFCVINLGVAALAVGQETISPARLGMLVHFLAVPVAALALAWALRRGGGWLWACSFLLAVGVGFALLWLLTQNAAGLGRHHFSLLLVPALTLNWPAALWFYFRSRPDRPGLTLGLAMSAAEMIWILLVPFVSAAFTQTPPAGQAMYLSQTMVFLLMVNGVGLTATLIQTGRSTGAAPVADERLSDWRPMLWLMAGAFCFFALFGLSFNSGTPRTAVQPDTRAAVHFFLLAGAPLAGWLLDWNWNRGIIFIVAGLGLAAVSVLGLTFFGGPFLSGCFVIMTVARSVFLLILFLGAARLMGSGPRLAFWGGLAYSIYLAQFVGNVLGRACAGLWGEGALPVAQTALLAGLVLGLWRVLRHFKTAPVEKYAGDRPAAGLPDSPPSAPVPSPAAADLAGPASPDSDESARHAAFGTAFGLTRREVEVLEGLRRGLEPAGLAGELGISERTVRFHLTGILRKTGRPNRQTLMRFYVAWVAKPGNYS
ncbi:helix-turn-helix transcriptional regulator [Deltaproteobacteria bacterium OttesenSCG-928-M10]|nr:helix-turn-helix transcriptional regulator [Deltaproteobacteria bacterium OttesenSCG-928-M10]